jgi:hypothetical protein
MLFVGAVQDLGFLEIYSGPMSMCSEQVEQIGPTE